jgi:formylglycine-generating enzyme
MRRVTVVLGFTGMVTVMIPLAGACVDIVGVTTIPGVIDGGSAESGSSAREASCPGDGGRDADGAVDVADAPSADVSDDAGPLSCRPGGPGLTNCGATEESCCTSLEVEGGTYFRTFDESFFFTDAGVDDAPTDEDAAATVSSFRLDKYSVTVGRFARFKSALETTSPYTPPDGSGKHTYLDDGGGLTATGGGHEPGWVASQFNGYFGASVPGDAGLATTDENLNCDSPFSTWANRSQASDLVRPMNCVTWYEAYAFCIWDGGFLPSEAEWEYAAAGGSEQRAYPWGSTYPGTNNEYAIYGDSVGDCYYPSGTLIPCTGVENIAPVGTATLGVARWGQLDMTGDVYQWNLDWYAPTYAGPCDNCANLTEPSTNARRASQGGSFNQIRRKLFSSDRDASSPQFRYEGLGIRCARSP